MNPTDILVVEDDADLREALAAVLQREGYAVRQAENGQVGFALASQRAPALVLLDLMMPVMTGWEMLDAMRASPELRSVPVLILTAAAPPPSVPAVAKPVSMDELLALVRRIARPATPGAT